MMPARAIAPALSLCLLSCMQPAQSGNPCLEKYPAMSGQVLKSDGGRVARIEPVTWLEEGVYRVTVESGGQFMTRPGDLALPEIGSELELRIFSKEANADPMAGCYCRKGTDICVEEYSWH